MISRFDAAVIGTGQAGPPLADRLTRAGMTVVVIERSRFGGTCVNTGCMPTKTMVASAYAAHLASRAADYGVTIEGRVTTDMKKVVARKNRVSNTAQKNIKSWLASMPGCTVMRGHARFASPNEIEVDGNRMTADKIFINVGGRALVPPIPGVDQVDFLTNETIMNVESVPPHLLILGGSYIGLEFAEMFRRFGSKVTVVEAAPRLVPREDDDVSDAIREILEREGVTIHLATKCTGLAGRGAAIVAQGDAPTGAVEIEATHLLLAIGRRPNTDDLGLDRAGLRVDQRGFIPTDEYLRTAVPNIYALGDCNGRGAFTHTSYNDFEIVVANLLDGEQRRVTDRLTTYGLFIDPALGRVGLTEREVRETGRKALIGNREMTRVGRAIEKGETLGFMKVLIDAETFEILGAAILGTGGDEAVHSITATMYARAPYTTLQRAVQIHPTVSELIPTMLGELVPV
jgi:pyruvate/2-oxoglutarate dehydrogenase complex dihydrolipoamide dehydrogenase (E3) component